MSSGVVVVHDRSTARFALRAHVESKAGRCVTELADALDRGPLDVNGWNELDSAVFDLYGLGEADRIIVRDGLFRAGWPWRAGRESPVAPAAVDDLGYREVERVDWGVVRPRAQ